LALTIKELRARRNAVSRKNNGVFSVWRRDCLIAGVPLENATHRVALGYLARSFVKSFDSSRSKGFFYFLTARSATLNFAVFSIFAFLTFQRFSLRLSLRF
jgi:hypothetical protein